MRQRLTLMVLVITPLLVIAKTESTPGNNNLRVTGDPSEGKNVYMTTCFACHGVDGKGVLPGSPNFTKAKGPMDAPDSLLVSRVVNGFQSPGSLIPMPPKGGNLELSEQNILDAITYIRSEFSDKHKKQ